MVQRVCFVCRCHTGAMKLLEVEIQCYAIEALSESVCAFVRRVFAKGRCVLRDGII